MSGQDCDGAKRQAPIKTLLAKPLHLIGHLEIGSTDHSEGILPVTLKVRPEPR